MISWGEFDVKTRCFGSFCILKEHVANVNVFLYVKVLKVHVMYLIFKSLENSFIFVYRCTNQLPAIFMYIYT